jgi:hypothetical protein
MPITSRATGKIFGDAYNYGDDYLSGTVEVNFKPQSTSASVWIYQTIFAGNSSLGIRSFEFRDTPTGPNKKKDFGDNTYYSNWPPTAFHALMTRVTFAILLVDNYCAGGFSLDFWS